MLVGIALTLQVLGAHAQSFDQLVRLYDYDQGAPLAVEQKEVEERSGIKIYAVGYALPQGDRVNGMLIVPPGKERHGAIIWMHSSDAIIWARTPC